ncbi:MAG TPA: hypothetical protein PLC98_25020 [Anaerolineales bacterium]|nr:hypothetical protein [Anaerolineales bacterium]
MSVLAACSENPRVVEVTAPPEIVFPVETQVVAPIEVTRLVMITEEIPVTVEVTRTIGESTIETQGIGSMPYEVGPRSGTYGFSTQVEGQGCELAVVERLLATTMNALEFEVFCSRGTPSFNMGYIQGIAGMVGSVAVYAVPKSPIYEESADEPCYLVFDFSLADVVKVTQIGVDYVCGSGNGVYFDGQYERTDASVPEMGCLDPEKGCP